MATAKWRLSGSAYGRIYDSELAFLGKESVAVPINVASEHLRTTRKTNDLEYKKLIETVEQAKFQTEAGDTVVVSPRYVGSRLGSNDDGLGNTVCAFYFNGEYVALALYNEEQKQIVAQEY